jgi:hypothetical protein
MNNRKFPNIIFFLFKKKFEFVANFIALYFENFVKESPKTLLSDSFYLFLNNTVARNK